MTNVRALRALLTVAFFCALGGTTLRAAEDEAALIATLQNGTAAEKAITCKKLAVCGSKAAVPALSALLADEKLSAWARIALQALPDSAADDALRVALDKLQGNVLAGVVNSIGMRRDPKAVDALIGKFGDADPEVAAAAATALGRIGGEKASSTLVKALPGARTPLRAAVAEGCVRCAEHFLAEGKKDDAIKLYDAVRNLGEPKQSVLDGTRGAILARGNAGIPMLLETLKSEDKAIFGIGMRTARELPGSEATAALIAAFKAMNPQRQALMVLVLADRKDPGAVPAILDAAKSGPKAVRLAALSVMDRVGNASCVPALLSAAVEDDAEIAQAAKVALIRLPSQNEIDLAIAAQLGGSSGAARQILIETIGQRRIETALPALVPCAEDANAGVRLAAINAIGTMGGEKQVPELVRVVQKTKEPAEREALERALTASCTRAGNASAAHLAPLAQAGEPALRSIALHALVCAGGTNALSAVKTALNDAEASVQDEAVRTLSNWPNKWPSDAGVVAPLLNLAQNGSKPPHKILGLRGYLQYLQGDKNVKDEERMTKLNEIQPLVTRVEEKRLVSSVLGTIATAKSLEMLLAMAADPSTEQEACQAIINLGENPALKALPKEQRVKALRLAAEKVNDKGAKRRAADALRQQ